MSIENARPRAARGAALMDEKRPGWRDRVDADRLQMCEPCGCIVGQDFRDEWRNADETGEDAQDPYLYGLAHLGLKDRFGDAMEIDHGFLADPWAERGGVVTYDDLNEAWVEILAATP